GLCCHRIVTVSLSDPPTTVTYTLSLHDALPISGLRRRTPAAPTRPVPRARARAPGPTASGRAHPGRAARRRAAPDEGGRRRRRRSEEHTSELQSRVDLVCRLLLEKKKKLKLL